MFQTGPILFLQSFESDLLNTFFGIINSLGYSEFFVGLPIVMMFSVHFRKSFYLLHIVLWTGVATNFLKEFFALPRPTDVDLNVRFTGTDYINPTKFDSMGARSFFGRLPDEVVTYYRGIAGHSFGLPSGHVSSTTALWAGMYTVFRQPWVRILSVAIVILMPITRMYLGRHFIIDVLGGLALGMTFVLFYYFMVYRSQGIRGTYAQKVSYFSLDLGAVLQWAYLVILPLIIFWITSQGKGTGALLGLNAGFLLIAMKGLPLEGGSFSQRAFRALLSAVFFHGPNILLKNLGLDDTVGLEFIRYAISSFLMMYITVELSVKLRLYRRADLTPSLRH